MTTRRPELGQSLVLVAFAMTALLGMLGLGIDFGYLRYSKRQLQSLADAAAVAAAQQITACGASPGCSTLTTAAQTALQNDNGVSNVSASTSCANSPTLGQTIVVINNPPACLPQGTTFPGSDPNYGNNTFAEALVFQNRPTFFSRIFGVNSMQMAARAEARNNYECVYALDPIGVGAINISASINAPCGIMDESDANQARRGREAFICAGGTLTAPFIGVHGGVLNSCGGENPTADVANPNPNDPLASLQALLASQAPGNTNCSDTESGTLRSGNYMGSSGLISIRGSVILNPGTYCGGITIGTGATVTMNPGIYTLTSTTAGGIAAAGGLNITSGAVTGTGIGFYNYGSGSIDFSGGNVTLTAPNATNCGGCGSAWQGILFYQDTADTAGSIVPSANMTLTGTFYFPDAAIQYASSAAVNYNLVVAKDITITSATNFYNNYSELSNGSPIQGGTTVVE